MAFNRQLVLFEKCLLCLFLFSMLFLSIWQIILRNFFSGGFFWIDQILRICVLWIVFTGASLAFEYKRHINIDILTNVIKSAKMNTAVSIIAQSSAMIICLILLIASIDYIRMASSNSSATIFSAIPDWYFRLIIPYCFSVMVIRAPINIYRLFNREENPE